MQDRRVVEFPYCGEKEKAVKLPASVIVVFAAQEADGAVVVASEFGVPFPVMVMPMFDGTTMPEDHAHVPAGMLMISPSTAVCEPPTHVPPLALIQAFTSATAQVL